MADASIPALQLDDIQAGALFERPSPYVGTYVMLRITDRADGRELVRRLHRIATASRTSDMTQRHHPDRGIQLQRSRGSGSPAVVTGQLCAGVPRRDGSARSRAGRRG